MKNSKGVALITVILICIIAVVLILGGIYLMLSNLNISANIGQISSDTTYKAPESVINNANVQDNKNVLVNNENTKKVYLYSEIKGRYTYTTETNGGIYVGFDLELFENGTFHYRYRVDNDSGDIGNYIIIDDTIILNRLYKHGSELGLIPVKGQIKLKINNDGTITDNNNLLKDEISKEDKLDLSTVILKRNTMDYDIVTVEDMIKQYDEYQNNLIKSLYDKK